MKKLAFILTAAVSISLMAFISNPPAATYTIDTELSQVNWTGYHLAKSYEHTGTVSLKSGNLKFDGDKISGGTFIIDMTTIKNVDLDDAKKNAKLTKHLKSKDFFGVEKYPEAKLEIKSSEKTADGSFNTTADLTIRGITKPISFVTKVLKLTDGEINASADITIERTQYEVMYGWKAENAMLSEDFKIAVNLTGTK